MAPNANSPFDRLSISLVIYTPHNIEFDFKLVYNSGTLFKSKAIRLKNRTQKESRMNELVITLSGLGLVTIFIAVIISIFKGPDKKASKELARVLIVIAIILVATAMALHFNIFGPILERIRFE